MKIYPFKPTLPLMELIPSPDSFFSSIKSQYLNHKAAGFFIEEDIPLIFVHEIVSPLGNFVGIIAANDIADLKKKHILAHENTLESKEQTMMNFLMKARAMVKPILLAYEPVKEIDQIINHVKDKNEPDKIIEFEHDLVQRFWKIKDKTTLDTLANLFDKKVKNSYIADGHHRCATVLKMAKNQVKNKDGKDLKKILSAYYSFDNLKVYDYNRIVDIQGEISPIKLLAKLSKYCKIRPLTSPGKPDYKHVMHFLMAGEWFEARWKKKILDKYAGNKLILDASLINKYIFKKILNIEDVRVDPRISYSSGVLPLSEVAKPLKKEKYKIGIFLHPLDLEDVLLAADYKLSLPPKSTWFEPRIKSGLVVNEF